MTGPLLPLPAPPLADEAAGIVLRPWRADDADAAALAAAWADPEVAAHAAVPADAGPAAARRWVAGDEARRRRGLALDLVIAPAPSGRPVSGGGARAAAPEPGGVLGEVGLALVEGAGARRAELGFWLAPEARGRGVVTAAVRLLTAWALAPAAGPPGSGLGLRQVWARTTPGDRRAAGVLRRAGFDERGEAGGTTVWATPPAMLRA
jgi:RimJ/RimL family protein N-acetyltransferase